MKRDPLRIEVCRDADDLARHAAQSFVSVAGMSLGSRGRLDVALAGGDAARRMYDVLAEDHMAFQIVWPAVHVYWSDELCVPRDGGRGGDGDRQQAQALLAKVGVPDGNIHTLRGDQAALRGVRFDLIVLDALDSLTPDGASPAPEIIQSARFVMVLASGEAVAPAAQRMLGAEGDDNARAQAFRPANGQLLWLLDAEAASLLPLPEAQAGTGEAPGPLPDISV